MPWSKEDRSFKQLINKRVTSSGKSYYEELGDNTINVHEEELWSQSISIDPTVAVMQGVAEEKLLFVMTEETSVANQQCYYAYSSGNRLKDWISEKYSSSYSVHLYQNNGTEIFPTDSCQWFFDYPTGILTFNGSTSSFSKPFKISGYRYIGTKGAGIQMLGKEVYYWADVTSSNQTLFNLPYTPLNPDSIRMFPEGGIEFINATDFTCTGTTLTYIAGMPSLQPGDRMVFQYTRQ